MACHNEILYDLFVASKVKPFFQDFGNVVSKHVLHQDIRILAIVYVVGQWHVFQYGDVLFKKE